jgi:Mg/Co/Ni transporter MgtE
MGTVLLIVGIIRIFQIKKGKKRLIKIDDYEFAIKLNDIENGAYERDRLVLFIEEFDLGKVHLLSILRRLEKKNFHLVHEKIFEKISLRCKLSRLEEEEIISLYEELPDNQYQKLMHHLEQNHYGTSNTS